MVNHLAIILDGNRRYAKSLKLQPWKGHEYGAEVVNNLVNWCKEAGIKELTLYVLSTENLKRDKKELEFLFKLFKEWMKKIRKDERMKKAKIRFIGNLDLVPKDTKEMAENLQKDTSSNKEFIMNLCFAYGGRLELLEAFKKLKNKKDITEHDITDALWLSSEPELIIRTGDRTRTSNFLPWQSVYSEWIFLKKMWPEFTKQDLADCLKEFSSRKRNFGK